VNWWKLALYSVVPAMLVVGVPIAGNYIYDAGIARGREQANSLMRSALEDAYEHAFEHAWYRCQAARAREVALEVDCSSDNGLTWSACAEPWGELTAFTCNGRFRVRPRISSR